MGALARKLHPIQGQTAALTAVGVAIKITPNWSDNSVSVSICRDFLLAAALTNNSWKAPH